MRPASASLHDIALAGFDDIPISRYVNPPLTTVRARIAELGGLALERLASAIEEPEHAFLDRAPDASRRPGRAPVDDGTASEAAKFLQAAAPGVLSRAAVQFDRDRRKATEPIPNEEAT